jgi:RNA polymerase sigma factor (sigma-70 family)
VTEDHPLLGTIRDRVSRAVRLRFALHQDAFVRRVCEVLSTYASAGQDPSRLLASLVLDDLYLATACANGDEAAWEELASVHFPFIRDFALSCARRDPPAGDVAEAVIADLWQRGKIRQFAGRSSLRTWLGTIVARTAINTGKRAEKTVPLELLSRKETLPDAHPIFADEALAREIADAASLEIARLDPPDQLLLLLYYEQEMTLAQMERVLRKSKAALSRRLDRVRRELKSRIETRVGQGVSGAGVDLSRVQIDLAEILSPAADRKIKLDPVSQS